MAINWGIALGSAVKSGFDTYVSLDDIETRRLQKDQLKKQIAEKEALDKAHAETQGRVGSQTDFVQALQTPETGIGPQQAAALDVGGNDPEFARANAQAVAGAANQNLQDRGITTAPAPTLQPQEYTQERANRDYISKASAISREGGVQALQIAGLNRQERVDRKFYDDYTSQMEKLSNAGETGNVGVLTKFAKGYGYDIKQNDFKSGASTYEVRGKDGKVIDTFHSPKALSEAIGAKFTENFFTTQGAKLFGNAKDAFTAFNQQSQLRLKEKEVESLVDLRKATIDNYKSVDARAGAAARANSLEGKIEEGVKLFTGQPKNGEQPDAQGKYKPDQLYTAEEARRMMFASYTKLPKDAEDPGVAKDYRDKLFELRETHRKDIGSIKHIAAERELKKFFETNFGYVPKAISREKNPDEQLIEDKAPAGGPPPGPALPVQGFQRSDEIKAIVVNGRPAYSYNGKTYKDKKDAAEQLRLDKFNNSYTGKFNNSPALNQGVGIPTQ